MLGYRLCLGWPREHTRNGSQHTFDSNGLYQLSLKAMTCTSISVVELRVAGERYGWHIPSPGSGKQTHLSQKGEAIFVGQADVRDKNVRTLLLEHAQGIRRRLSRDDVRPVMLQNRGQNVAVVGVIVDH